MKIINSIKAVFFISVPLFLIGHGLGGDVTEIFTETCERPSFDQENDTYYITSTVDYGDLTGNGTFQLTANGTTYSTSSGIFGPIRNLDEGETFRITINSNETEAEFGQMLLLKGRCADASKTIHLSAPVIADRIGQFFESTYSLRDADFGVSSTSSGPSMASYILSGGETGSESINIPGSLDVFVNSVLVYDGNDGDINSPISFVAGLDDEVEVVVSSSSIPGTTSQIWLHTPNGEGTRLAYNIELIANSEFRAIYKIDSAL